MARGKNKDFIMNGTLNLLRRNYGIEVKDTHEIDSSLSISENVENILDKHSLHVSTLQDLQ